MIDFDALVQGATRNNYNLDYRQPQFRRGMGSGGIKGYIYDRGYGTPDISYVAGGVSRGGAQRGYLPGENAASAYAAAQAAKDKTDQGTYTTSHDQIGRGRKYMEYSNLPEEENVDLAVDGVEANPNETSQDITDTANQEVDPSGVQPEVSTSEPKLYYEGSSPTSAEQNGLTSQEQTQIEQNVDKAQSIEELLVALKQLGTMQAPQQIDPVFQLDDAYKASNALTGLNGTVAQYPIAGGRTRETEYYL